MRIVQSRKRVFKEDYAFSNKFTLLVWVLSILKWKEYGNQVVLYTDTKTLEEIKKIGFDTLYDEIDTKLLEDKELTKGIDFYCYWAMPKLLSLKHEKVTLGNDVVVADTDVVPMSDVSRMWTNTDIAVWSNKEHVEIRSIYPELYDLSVPSGYKFPKWFTGKAKPLNTGIIHIKGKEIVELFVDEAVRIATDNHNAHQNTNCITMCNAEQRTLGEIVKAKNLTYSVMQPINEGLFNRNGFHTHGYKNAINNDNGLDWHCTLLQMIRKSNYAMYQKLINNEWFKDEKEHMSSYTKVKELVMYNG